MKTQHTPTPWERNGLEIQASNKHETLIAEMFDGMGDGMANAAFIVRAVNSHDELLKIAKAYREALTGGSLHWTDEVRMTEKIDKAIAQAEGK